MTLGRSRSQIVTNLFRQKIALLPKKAWQDLATGCFVLFNSCALAASSYTCEFLPLNAKFLLPQAFSNDGRVLILDRESTPANHVRSILLDKNNRIEEITLPEDSGGIGNVNQTHTQYFLRKSGEFFAFVNTQPDNKLHLFEWINGLRSEVPVPAAILDDHEITAKGVLGIESAKTMAFVHQRGAISIYNNGIYRSILAGQDWIGFQSLGSDGSVLYFDLHDIAGRSADLMLFSNGVNRPILHYAEGPTSIGDMRIASGGAVLAGGMVFAAGLRMTGGSSHNPTIETGIWNVSNPGINTRFAIPGGALISISDHNSRGDLAFTLLSGSAGADAGVFVSTANGLLPVLRKGDLVGRGFYDGQSGIALINDNRDVVVLAGSTTDKQEHLGRCSYKQ